MYLKNAGAHACPAEGTCFECAMSNLEQSMVELCDTFAAFGRAVARSRSIGGDWTVRPWRWQRTSMRRNRSWRQRPVIRARILRFGRERVR